MRALVLSGGGAKGAYQVGVLRKWIADDRIDYQAFIGTSVGAINSASLAQAPPDKLVDQYNTLRAMWEVLDTSDVYRSWPLGMMEAVWRTSVYNSDPIHRLIRSNVSAAKLRSSGRSLRVVAVSWRSGEVVIRGEYDPDIADWVYASASFPVFFAPADIKGELYTDGGVREIAPLSLAIKMGATEIDVIVTSDPERLDDWPTKGKASFAYLMRAVDIMSTEILLNDLRTCGLVNQLVRLGEAPGKRDIKLRVVKPSGPLGESLSFDPSSIQKMLVLGYRDAQAYRG